MSKTYRLVLPLLLLWLLGWIALSWAAIQDDALIHLRYAENLVRTHRITYYGVHPSYGASSLLYVHLLALLSWFVHSPNLPRAVSSGAHLLLFVGTAPLLLRFVPVRATLARLLGLTLLCLLVTPSAVRWLDDGMETGLGLCVVEALCFAVFLQSRPSSGRNNSGALYIGIALLAFFAVLLRIEFSLLCGLSFVFLLMSDSGVPPGRSILRRSHLLVGCGLALLFIFARMHALLPDAALAKSNRSSHEVLAATANVLASAMSFGVVLMLFWLLTLWAVLRAARRVPQTILANSIFPVMLLLSSMRGQEIQGVRYLAWTLYFPALWNVLELGQLESDLQPQLIRQFRYITGAFVVLLLAALPFESRAMSHVLRARARTLERFEDDHLRVLEDQQGVAVDVGYIGYFTHANICDLAGLVNGRAAARLTSPQRDTACAAQHPGFLFLRADQLRAFAPHIDIGGWEVCTLYDFANLTGPDTHYLLLPAATGEQLCRQISPSAIPYPATTVLP